MPYSGKQRDLNAASSSLTLLPIIVTLNPAGEKLEVWGDLWLANIRGEERFKKLMERVKYEWEHFEV
jgi:hypothetical protein